MQTTTSTHAGGNADLLSGILGVEIRNEEKITAQDRLYCEKQQEQLYKSLEQIDRWYGIFTKEAEKYRESHKISYKENGEISTLKNYIRMTATIHITNSDRSNPSICSHPQITVRIKTLQAG